MAAKKVTKRLSKSRKIWGGEIRGEERQERRAQFCHHSGF